MATIEKRNGSYRITVSCGYDTQGKQIKQKMTYTPEENMTAAQIKKELNRQATLFEESVKNGQALNKNIKFEVFAKQWIEQIELEGDIKISTLEKYKQMQKRIYEAIGHMKLNNITTMHVQRFINSLSADGANTVTGGGLATKTQANYLNFISDVFNYAIRCNLAVVNPCRNVHTIKLPPKERECYTLEEAQEFLSALDTAPIKYKTFFTLAIYTGFRNGELLGLEWKDINFDTRVISINRTSFYKSGEGMVEGTPKTKSSQRSLKMTAEIISMLKEYKTYQAQERLKLGDRWKDNDRLFTTWDGGAMSVNTARIWLKKFCEQNGLRYVTIHSFRHLNASLLISSGVDIKTVSSVLGHSQTSTTLNIYAHAFAEAQAEATKAVADALQLKKA